MAIHLRIATNTNKNPKLPDTEPYIPFLHSLDLGAAQGLGVEAKNIVKNIL